jgi:succinyl-CoA synthetase beta subunit
VLDKVSAENLLSELSKLLLKRQLMKVHEYQAKGLFKAYSIRVPESIVVTNEDRGEGKLEQLKDGIFAVKAQIHAGGRGKGTLTKGAQEVGRGVCIVKGKAEAKARAEEMLDATLVTIQTGPAGKLVNKVLIEEGVDIEHEFYLGMVIDRAKERIAIMASTEGGTEIEKVAAQTPHLIKTAFIDPLEGFSAYQGRKLGFSLGLSAAQVKGFVPFVSNLYKLFTQKDASLAEINPLVLNKDGDFIALDGKLSFDDNASYRQKALSLLRDLSEEEPSEVEADAANLSYIKLDGNIGCLVNGAGLAMATMDIIKEFGGAPANFLDVGGTATPKNVAISFKLMMEDKVGGIFVNIFGGIVRCDVVAQGLVDALGGMELKVPLVVRLAGNREEEARAILADSGLPIVLAKDMEDGARKIVDACA